MADIPVNSVPKYDTPPAIEPVADLDDVDEIEAVDDETANDSNLSHLKSTDIRRRIEERLEVRMLKDELGMDDFDL